MASRNRGTSTSTTTTEATEAEATTTEATEAEATTTEATEAEAVTVTLTLTVAEATEAVTIPAVAEGATLPAEAVAAIGTALRNVTSNAQQRALAIGRAVRPLYRGTEAEAATADAVAAADSAILAAARTASSANRGRPTVTEAEAEAVRTVALAAALLAALPAEAEGREAVALLAALPLPEAVAEREGGRTEAEAVRSRLSLAATEAASYGQRTRTEVTAEAADGTAVRITLADVIAGGGLTVGQEVGHRSGGRARATVAADGTLSARGQSGLSASAAARLLAQNGQEANGWRDLVTEDGTAIGTLRSLPAVMAAATARHAAEAS